MEDALRCTRDENELRNEPDLHMDGNERKAPGETAVVAENCTNSDNDQLEPIINMKLAMSCFEQKKNT